MTYTKGDLLYGDASNGLAILNKGTAYEILRTDSTATTLEWYTPTVTQFIAMATAMYTSTNDTNQASSGSTTNAARAYYSFADAQTDSVRFDFMTLVQIMLIGRLML